ncbi:MAG: hypothetical protein K8R74_12680 [Bacteroidales bacterium]|nr:hypothetical protein [Bacteroidales bacterium]
MKIGGEFEVDPKVLCGFGSFTLDQEQILFSSGRSALMAILNYLGNIKTKTIYIPYYICKSVVTSCLNMGYRIEFYELTDDYTFPLELLPDVEKNASILLVNYFGFVDVEKIIKTIKKNRPDICTIYDNVQSFWTYKNTIADFSFTSLRKHFATPDGALVFSNLPGFRYKMNLKENSFYWPKFIGALLKTEKIDDSLYLHFFKEGERLLDEDNEITASSKLAQFILSSTDFEEIKRRRFNNTKLVYEIGNEFGIDFMFEFSEKVIPLVVPIFVKNRDEIRKRLFNKKVFLPIHWPEEEFNKTVARTREIANSELSLVIDQRYSEEEMKYQMEMLFKNS